MFAISTDGGSSFDRLQFDRQLISPECQGSMLEAGGSLYFSNPRSTATRTNMSVLRSDTNGANWSAHVAVSAVGVATSSSCLVDLSTPGETKVGTAGEATVGLMYERGTDDCVGASCEIVFTTLPPSRFTPLIVRDLVERHPVLKNDDSAAKIVVNADGDHAGYAESIFPEDPNYDAQGRSIPIQQNTCKGKSYPSVQYEQGQLFQVTAAGHVVAVRFFAAALERGAHEARIWRMADKQKLTEVTISMAIGALIGRPSYDGAWRRGVRSDCVAKDDHDPVAVGGAQRKLLLQHDCGKPAPRRLASGSMCVCVMKSSYRTIMSGL